MRRRFVTLDVFTDRRFAGNPLAVVLDAEHLETADMQAIAHEFNHPETVFVFASGDPAHRARIRIFTPRRELPFAGHPTVGTAVLLGLRDGGGVGPRDRAGGADRRGALHARRRPRMREVAPRFTIPQLPAEVGPVRGRRDHRDGAGAGAGRHRRVPPGALVGRDALHIRSRQPRVPRSSVAVLISPASTAPSARVARPMSSAARPSSPAMVSTPACSRPAWASRKIRPPAPRPRRLPACSLRTCPTGRIAVTIEQGYEMGRPSLIRLVAVVEAGRVLSLRSAATPSS